MVLLHIENSKNDRLKVILLCGTLTRQTATSNITFSLSFLLFSMCNNTIEPLTAMELGMLCVKSHNYAIWGGGSGGPEDDFVGMIGAICNGHCTASSTRSRRVHSLLEGRLCRLWGELVNIPLWT